MPRNLLSPLLTPATGGTETFRSVDLLRGLASLAILVVHYKHFFNGGGELTRPFESISQVPFYSIWSPIYAWGSNAVQLFWLISGFVFLHVYADRTGIGWRAFFLSRFARLYPLHLVTLLAVALLQMAKWHTTGSFSIYGHNDVHHFLLNLIFASEWGLQEGRSFNGPVWSVSVEIFSYLLFFMVLRSVPLSFVNLSFFACAGLVLYALTQSLVMLCIIYFFAGCLTYMAMRWLLGAARSKALHISIFFLGTTLTVAVINDSLPRLFIYIPLFGSLLLVACFTEIRFGSQSIRRLDWLGHTSYGNYLWHTPLQMLFLLVAGWGWVSVDRVYEAYFMPAYIAVVVAVSLASYRWLERPAQAAIQRSLSDWSKTKQRKRDSVSETPAAVNDMA